LFNFKEEKNDALPLTALAIFSRSDPNDHQLGLLFTHVKPSRTTMEY